MRVVPQGLMFDGHDTPRAELVAAAAAELERRGMHPLDAGDAVADRPGLVVRAWYGGDELGFVQEHHDGAQAVTVVHCAVPA